MQSTMMKLKAFRPAMGPLVLALVMAGAVAGTLAPPAHADDWRREHERARFEREHEHEREWRLHHHRPVYVAPPPVVYAPPPVVYAPPPAGINLIFPLSIR